MTDPQSEIRTLREFIIVNIIMMMDRRAEGLEQSNAISNVGSKREESYMIRGAFHPDLYGLPQLPNPLSRGPGKTYDVPI